MGLKQFKPQYPCTISVDWFPSFFLITRYLREFDKRSKHFFFDDHFFSNPHNLFYDVWILWGEFFSSLLGERELQFDYYNWGHLDKVNQSDYRKITICSKKVSCKLPWNKINNTDQNQLITTYRRDLLKLAEESQCFPTGLLEWVNALLFSCNPIWVAPVTVVAL